MVRNQNDTKNVLTAIKAYRKTLTNSYHKNGLALSWQTTIAVINSYKKEGQAA